MNNFVLGLSVSATRSFNSYYARSATTYAVHPITQQLIKIDPEQAWFWSPDWFQKEMEAERELLTGEYEEFESLDEFISSL